jgi:riboflavin biosynthesis pyrimidine reductase
MLLSFDLRALALLFAGLLCRPDETTVAGPPGLVLPTCYISDAIASEPPTLKHLLPADADEIVAGFELDRLPTPTSTDRPRVILNMVSTVDGHATLEGRSRALSSPADRALFHALRLAVDAVMAGAGTMRAERYGRIVPDAARRRLRVERGQSEEPLACIVSGRLDLNAEEIPLLADPTARVAIVTPSAACVPRGSAAEIHYIRAERDGRLDLPAALAELRERFGVHTLLCEGGPHLNAQLLAAGLVDELFLSLAPLLTGSDLDGSPAHPNLAHSEALPIIAGGELSPPVEMRLLSVLEHDSHLFLRYGVRGRRASSGRLLAEAGP